MVALFTSFASPAHALKPVDCNKEESFPIIGYAELNKVAESKSATIIDVNSDESFQKQHVTNAIHYDKKLNLAKVLPAAKDSMIVAYCGGPACTAWHKAAKEACKQGYTNIYHYKDGISGWEKSSAKN